MKRLFVLFLILVIVAISLIPVCAMDVVPLAYSKVNIADHLIGKEYVDNDIRLTYSVPVAPYTEMGGVMRDGNIEQLDQTTFVDFRNGKISITEPAELLYSWDFTKSLEDSMSGEVAVLGNGVVQNETGLVFPQQGSTASSAYVGLINKNYDFHGKTIDIDIVNGNLTKTVNQHARIFSVVNSGYGAHAGGATFAWRYNKDPGWALYASDYGWSTSLEDIEYPLDYFNQKTLRLEVDTLGYLTVSVAPLGTDDFTKIHTFEKRFLSPGYLGYLVLGSSFNNDLYPFVVSGVRIYENESTVEINKYVKMNFDMLIMGTHYFEDVRVIDITDLRAGSEFDITFMLENAMTIDGTLHVPDGTAFEIQYLDKDFQKLTMLSIPLEVHEAQLVDGNTWSYTFDGRVPRGAQYMYLQLTCHGMQVEGAEAFTWMITALNMSFNISALEEQSKTQQQILNKLDGVADMLTPTPEQSDKADQMEDAIGDAADKLENNNSSLGQLTPTRPQINTNLEFDQEQMLAVSPLVTNIWSINGLGRMISIVLVVATVAYIFFGKRDG